MGFAGDNLMNKIEPMSEILGALRASRGRYTRASNEEIRDWYDAHLTSATIASTARRFGRSREEILAILREIT